MIKLDKETFKKYLDAGILVKKGDKVFTKKGIEVYNYEPRPKQTSKVSKPKASSK